MIMFNSERASRHYKLSHNFSVRVLALDTGVSLLPTRAATFSNATSDTDIV